jgi:SpoVK/Ycf46/Vps4 family AAA+-type ATPase
MYIFIEYLSSFTVKKLIRNIIHINYNQLKNYYYKRKYKTVTLTKRRYKISSKWGFEDRYETTKEIDAVINYISKNTTVNHYNYSKEDISNMHSSLGYLEPSESTYNINFKPFTNTNDKFKDKEILLDIIVDMYDKGADGQHTVNESHYKLYSDNMNILTEFINKCIKEYDEHLEQLTTVTKYYSIYQGEDVTKYREKPENTYLTFPLIVSKTFDNIFLPEKKRLLDDLNFFLDNKQWFINKGIQYSFGILLKGEPGTGKTSVIKAIAKYTNRHIIDVPLNKVKTMKELLNIFKENSNGMIYSTNENEYKKIPRSNCILVLEDIDCVCDLVLSREFKKEILNYTQNNKLINKNNKNIIKNNNIIDDITDSDDKTDFIKVETYDNECTVVKKITKDNDITLSSLLNVLDGILESNGIIYIITTNYPEKIDKALLRPGRINFTIDFKKSDYQTIKEMLEYFYEIKLKDTNEYGIKENEHTTSYVSGLCISYKNDINKCIELLK